MGRKRKQSQPQTPRADKPVEVRTGLGSLLRAAVQPPQASRLHGAAGGSRRPGRHSRVPPTQPPPGPADPERIEPPSPSPSPLPSPSTPGAQPGPEPAQQPPADPADLRRLNDAYAGVRPLGRSRRRPSAGRRGADPARRATSAAAAREADEAAARARLDALVGGGVVFAVERDEDGRVHGLRQGAPRALLRTLRGAKYSPEAQLDLHGMHSAEADREVTRFVRARHRAGARYLMIIHGAGKHSEGGVGVLGDRAVATLTGGGAAPLVQAFATAHTRRGGLGALAVYLK